MPAAPSRHSHSSAASFRFGPRLWGAIAWLMLLFLCAAWVSLSVSRGYRFDTSIMALLPDLHGEEGSGAALSEKADQHLAELAGRRMIFLVSHTSRSQSVEAANKFLAALQQTSLFSELQGPIERDRSEAWRQAFFPYRYHLLSPGAATVLRQSSVDRQNPLLQQALGRLYSPLASAVGPTLIEDPLQLFFDWQLNAAPKSPFAPEEGWLTRSDRGRTYRLMAATLAGDPYELSYQQEVMAALDHARAGLPDGTEVLTSGLLRHAAYGAAQARREISTIGVGSMLGIALLLIYCFRRGRFLLLAFLPIAAGWLFALAASMAIFDSLHLITLAFGASLIGVAIDYSLHFLCAAHEQRAAGALCATHEQRAAGALCATHEQRAAGALCVTHEQQAAGVTALARILPGISLGLLSSALAYAAQGLAPFPGLRQMAVFSVCGLAGAWLTVVLWLPWFSGGLSRKTIPLHRLATILAGWLERWPTVASPRVAVAMAALAGLGLLQLFLLEFHDDVRHLQTSPAAMLEEDAQVQSLTRSVDPSRYFLLSAASEEQLLQTEEELQAKLRPLLRADQLYDYQALSRWVPSAATQEEHYALVRDNVYGRGGLAALLAKEIGSPQLVERMRASFQSAGAKKLSLQDWLVSGPGREQSYLWLGETAQQFHSLVMVAGIRDDQTLQALARFATIDGRVRFVDKVATISQVLKKHRQQLQLWIGLAYGAVLILLLWRYGHRAWRILAAPAIASLLALAILNWCGLTINIFNLMALLLVLGIGLDAGIFLSESTRGPYTWTAITLSAVTTLLAFGLLALSSTPVLQQFGITVLLGIVGVWCLAPCFVTGELVGQGRGGRIEMADSRA